MPLRGVTQDMTNRRNKLNYKIKNLEDRKRFLEEELDIESTDRRKWTITKKNERDINGGMDYRLEAAASYLLRSEDIDSSKNIEYSYFNDARDFNNEYRYKNPRLTPEERDRGDKDLYVVKSILESFDGDSSVIGKDFHGKPLKIIEYNMNEDSNNIFNIDENTKVRDVLKYIPYIDEIEDVDRRAMIKVEISDFVKSVVDCLDSELDMGVVELMMKDYTVTEMAEELNKTPRQVRYTISKIEKKYRRKNVE